MGTAEMQFASRRRFLGHGGIFLGAAITDLTWRSAVAATRGEWVLIENFSASGKSFGTVRLPKLIKSEAQWRAQLPPGAFEVTRHAGTEPAFTGAYWNNHADGLYRCICCNTALFDSRTKFESGTGWPSFYQPISKRNVVERADDSLFMQRTAISCSRCDAHLGHVFDDGPKPTGLRYCMNSASLRFVHRGKDDVRIGVKA